MHFRLNTFKQFIACLHPGSVLATLLLLLLLLLLMLMLLLMVIAAGAVLVRVSDSEVLLHGGADPASGQLFSDAWILSLDGMTWVQLEVDGLVARHALQAVALPDGGILVIGGSSAEGPTLQPQLLRRSGVAATVTHVTTARCNL
jgi:hypothetical protein